MTQMKRATPTTLLELLQAVARGGFHACARNDAEEDTSAIAAVDLPVTIAESRGYVRPAKRLLSSSRAHANKTKALIVPGLSPVGRKPPSRLLNFPGELLVRAEADAGTVEVSQRRG